MIPNEERLFGLGIENCKYSPLISQQFTFEINFFVTIDN